MRSFALVYSTRNPQQDVDAVHPRVVLFGIDARLVLAFHQRSERPDRNILGRIGTRLDLARATMDASTSPTRTIVVTA